MIVVLDANIWIKERLLRSSLGAALLYTLHQSERTIALPCVTKKEVIKGVARLGAKAVEQINQSFVTVQSLTGTRPEVKLPSVSVFEEKTIERFKELSDLVEEMNLKHEQYVSAVDRVIAKRPPNETREQYRDSLLWESVLDLVRKHEVHFLTEDRDFYQNKNLSRGLAKELIAEVEGLEGSVAIYSNLQEYLRTIERSIAHPDFSMIAARIAEAINEKLREYAEEKEFTLGEMTNYELEAFLTEQKNTLALGFNLAFAIFDVPIAEDLLPEGSLLVKGDCAFALDSQNVSDISFDQVSCIAPDGSKIPGLGTIYVRAESIVLGVRQIPYRLRRKLDEKNNGP